MPIWLCKEEDGKDEGHVMGCSPLHMLFRNTSIIGSRTPVYGEMALSLIISICVNGMVEALKGALNSVAAHRRVSITI